MNKILLAFTDPPMSPNRLTVVATLLLVPLWVAAAHGQVVRDDAAAGSAVESGEGPSTNDPLASNDPMRELQSAAIREQVASWGHWGIRREKYSTWMNHANRLIPVYTFGITLDPLRNAGSVYADPRRIESLYGLVPEGTLNPAATYHDQTDLHRLQEIAYQSGKSNIILMVFDGMDWQTTRAAAAFNNDRPVYESGRGSGLSFLDERRAPTDFGFVVTSSLHSGNRYDVNSQIVTGDPGPSTGGYDFFRGGGAPWLERIDSPYLIGEDRDRPNTVTDSAASATSLTCGIKTYNGAINVNVEGEQVVPIARRLQRDGLMIGVVTSVPVSHATPAAAYANNVTRKDYQDISRDLIGLPSSSHRRDPLPGVDVLIGGGHGEGSGRERLQGENFIAGNPYLHQDDIARVSLEKGGRYRVVQRASGQSGRERLLDAAHRAADNEERLLGFFGVGGGHLPYQTADGKFDPTFDVRGAERYDRADVYENPTLADCTEAALTVLERSIDGFWLMVEAGDVDWANHSNNLDNSIGAVLSGDAAFRAVTDWVAKNNAWNQTAIIVTADHGHYLVLDEVDQIRAAGAATRAGR